MTDSKDRRLEVSARKEILAKSIIFVFPDPRAKITVQIRGETLISQNRVAEKKEVSFTESPKLMVFFFREFVTLLVSSTVILTERLRIESPVNHFFGDIYLLSSFVSFARRLW